MVTVHWYELTFDGEYAVNNGDSIVIYDSDYNETQRITNLTYRDAPHISIEGGEWTQASEIPTALDRLQAQVDFLKMWHDGLQQSLTYPSMNLASNGWTQGRVFTTCTNSSIARGTMYLSALVFYNTVLTDTQHVQLANQINAL